MNDRMANSKWEFTWKKLRRFLFVSGICCVAVATAIANNITLINVKLTGQDAAKHYTIVQFDIRWENSWRTSSAPFNSDAAWVFVKFRVRGGVWQHATINNTGYNAPTGSAITPVSDGTGAFIYRDADGTGTFSATGVQLRWNYGVNGVADNATLDVKVYAIEMLYVPTGAFAVGSGGSESGHFYKYPTPTNSYQVSGEEAITVGTSTDNLFYTNAAKNADQAGPIPAAYPKGFSSFYCMKYEISQQAYVNFLNTLTYMQQATRTKSTPNSPIGTKALCDDSAFRNGIVTMTPGVSSTIPAVYACNLNGNETYNELDDGQDIVCNYLGWADVAAYLDWSGLRPMTELEFEKACRGSLSPVPNEYAWGNTTVFGTAYNVDSPGTSGEVVSNPGSGIYGNANYSKTSNLIAGPLRGGNFATSISNRIVSGATFYGIMDMCGNVCERTVTVGNETGRAFTGHHGNGTLDGTGNADVVSWPGADAVGAGFRGGGWTGSESDMQISYREYAALAVDSRTDQSYGGRGVRSAPYDNLAFDPLMVPVAGGTFTARSTSTTISSFNIDKYEITYDKWKTVAAWGATHGYTDLFAGQNGYNAVETNNPVTMVSWYDAVKWCNARSQKDGLIPVYYTSSSFVDTSIYKTGMKDIQNTMVNWTANGYRLPTEAEWEFAAKGGIRAQSPTAYKNSGSNTIDEVAWYSTNSDNTTHPVGTKMMNELGIYDMSGNAWEWCWDWYGNTYPSGGTSNPQGPSATQTYRVLRGGSFYYYDYACRSAVRTYDYPYNRFGYLGVGFRCVQD